MFWRNIFNATVRKRPGAAHAPEPEAGGNEPLLTAGAVRQLNRLHLNASRYLRGFAIGQRPSLRRKPALEFLEHRKYVAGDDVRFVDWKASARQEHIFVKQGEHPKEATIFILIDCSASMAWGQPSKRLAALRLASALGYLALAHGDRLVIAPLCHPAVVPLGPISGKGQLQPLVSYLRRLPFQGEIDLPGSVREFKRQISHGSGLALLISDLFGVEHLGPVLDMLPVPTWDVIVFHLLHPEELEPKLRGDYELQDEETGRTANYDITARAVATYRQRLKAWIDNLELAAVENSAFYLQIPSDWDLEESVLPHLRKVNILRPL